MNGSYEPFAKTLEERLAAGDSRPSLEERYGTKRGYLCVVQRAADSLVAQPLLLAKDARKLEQPAREDANLAEDAESSVGARSVADRVCRITNAEGRLSWLQAFARGNNTFDEDPLLSGLMGAAEVCGAQALGQDPS